MGGDQVAHVLVLQGLVLAHQVGGGGDHCVEVLDALRVLAQGQRVEAVVHVGENVGLGGLVVHVDEGDLLLERLEELVDLDLVDLLLLEQADAQEALAELEAVAVEEAVHLHVGDFEQHGGLGVVFSFHF